MKLYTGHPGTVLPKLYAALTRHLGTRPDDVPYFGRTNDPQRRINQHAAKLGFTEMTVIYRTSSLANAEKVERALIGRYCDPSSCTNVRRSSGGGRSKTGPYYVYLAF